jgi:3,4-dihydroxy 2-butanone 4-phosphate synthase / GTP cyclohydrolase II
MNEPWNIRPQTKAAFERVEAALERIAGGGMVLVVDDLGRENEADLLMAAEYVNSEAVNFMAGEGRGLICQTITSEQARNLSLPPQAADNTALHDTAFTVSVDAKHGVTSGISAATAGRSSMRPSKRSAGNRVSWSISGRRAEESVW